MKLKAYIALQQLINTNIIQLQAEEWVERAPIIIINSAPKEGWVICPNYDYYDYEFQYFNIEAISHTLGLIGKEWLINIGNIVFNILKPFLERL